MKHLTIIQAKPNPVGKDRFGNVTPANQLAGEWIDFRNTGNDDFSLANVELHHIAYTTQYPNGVWDKVMHFRGTLSVGMVVRIHSGGEIPLSSLRQIDVTGANYHLFTGANYIWNNDRGDSPRLVLKNSTVTTEIDKTLYAANPAEGKILKRQSNILV